MSVLKACIGLGYKSNRMVIILDHSEDYPMACKTITNAAEEVVEHLANNCYGEPLGERALYYRDTDGRFDQLLHSNGRFADFKACTDQKQITLNSLIEMQNSISVIEEEILK